MKTRIFILLLALNLSIQCYSQSYILEAYNAVPNDALPYQDSRQNIKTPPPGYGFSYFGWNKGTLKDNVYTDIGLTVSQGVSSDGWDISDLYRTFTPTNGSYKLCAVSIGCLDYDKTMLISINSNGNYIDAIEVAASMATASNGVFLYPEQWKIDHDMRVTVYQLKPTTSISIMFNSPILFPFQAQRIDKMYQINSTGHFALLSTTFYQPKNYTQYNFSDPNYNIWQGNEVPE